MLEALDAKITPADLYNNTDQMARYLGPRCNSYPLGKWDESSIDDSIIFIACVIRILLPKVVVVDGVKVSLPLLADVQDGSL